MIGTLRHKVTLLTRQRVADEGGGGAVSWLAGPDLWAEVERLTATRDFSGDRSNRLRRIAAAIRPRRDIELGMSLRFDGADYDIASIEDDGEGKRLTLVCEEALS